MQNRIYILWGGGQGGRTGEMVKHSGLRTNELHHDLYFAFAKAKAHISCRIAVVFVLDHARTQRGMGTRIPLISHGIGFEMLKHCRIYLGSKQTANCQERPYLI